MPDNLTLEFKRQLDERTKTALAKPTTLPSLTSGTGGSLWEASQTGQMPDWMSQGIDDKESGLLTAVGKGAWTALDITTLGVPGLIGRAIDPEWTKSMEPETFGERVAAGIGGAAGFLLPMAGARAVASAGVKAFASAGTKKFAQRYVDDTVNLMRKDKEFMAWVGKKVKRGEIEGGEAGIAKFLSSIVDEPKAALLSLGTKQGEAMFMRTAKNRKLFAKNFNDKLPKVMMEKLGEAGFRGRNAAQLVNTLGDDVALKIGTVLDDAGAAFKFPVTQMHGLLAGWMGNGKLGNVAAAAIEEAILFSAVELPLNAMTSLNNEEVDFSLTGTLGHAWLLGSALGLIRFIPWGKDQGTIRPAWNKMTKSLATRRRYAAYDVKNPADRLVIGEDAKRIFDMKKKPFNRIKKTVKEYKGNKYQMPISRKADIGELVKTEAGAAQVKGVLMDIERALYKSWWPKFLKEIPRDLIESTPRMLAGAFAFNYSGISDMAQGGYPWEDIVFNVALGMFMTKKGKPFEYTNSQTGKIEHLFDNRPYTYTNELKRVDRWLNMTNTGLDSSLYRILYNEQIAIENGFAGPDASTKDMQKLKAIAESEGLIVERYVGEDADGNRQTREKKAGKGADGKEIESTFEDEIYSTFAGIIDKNFKDKDIEYDVLDAYELSPEKLKSIKDKLAGEEFDSLKELSVDGSFGVTKSRDLVDIVLGSADAEAVAVREIYQNAVIDMYNKVYEILYGDKPYKPLDKDAFDIDGRLKLQPLDFTNSKIAGDDRLTNIFGDESSNLMRILGPQVSIQGNNPIRVTQKMVDAILGTTKNGEIDQKGLMHQYDDQLTELILGELQHTVPENRKMRVGQGIITDWVTNVLNRRSVRQHWRALEDIASINEINRNKIFSDESLVKIKELIAPVFDELGQVADRVTIKGATYESHPNEYSFVNSLLGVLRSDLNRNTGIERIVKETNLSDVQQLMREIDTKMPILTMRDVDTKRDLVRQLKDYTLDRSLSGLTKEGGRPLDAVDRSKIKYLIDSKMVTPNMVMLDVKGVIDNLSKTMDYFNENKAQLGKIESAKDWLSFIEGQKDGLHQLTSVLGNTKFLEQIFSASDQLGMTPAEFLDSMLTKYNDHILPYLKESGKVGGFLKLDKTGKGHAMVSAAWLAELNMSLDLLSEGIYKVSHDQLLEHIIPQMRAGVSGFSKDANSSIHARLKNIVNLFLHKPSTAPLAIKALVDSGLYDKSTGRFLFNDFDESTVLTKLKEHAEQMDVYFKILNSDRDLEVMWAKDRLDNESKFPVDKSPTLSVNRYVSKYNIKVEASTGETLNKMLQGNDQAMKNIFNFYDFMRNRGATLSYKGNKISSNLWGLKQFQGKHEAFIADTFMVYSQLKNSVTANKIKVNGQRPKYEVETFQRNRLYDEVLDLIGEFTLVDTSIVLDGRKHDIRTTKDQDIKAQFFNIIANKVVDSKQGFGTTMEVAEDLYNVGARTPYVVAFVGTMGDGIGIPIGAGQYKYEAINKIVREYINVVDRRIAEMGDDMHPDAIRAHESFRDRSLKSVEKEVDGETVVEWMYQEGDMNHQRVSQDMTVMLTNIFGDRSMGSEYWEAVRGEKWNDGDGYAKKQLRYMKLLFNRSAKPVTTEVINDAIDFLERTDNRGHPLFGFLGSRVTGETDSVKSYLKKLSSNNAIKSHVIGDENPINPDMVPEISSLFSSLSKQIRAEQEASGVVFEDFDIENQSMIGGLGDVSRFDSINIVSKEFMEAIKFLTGINNPSIQHMKPVGASASNGNAVFLDKTAWVVDPAWDKYLKDNNIDMVIMDSAAKMAGTDMVGTKGADGKSENIIYMDQFNSMESLMSSVNDGKTIGLPLDTFSIGSVVKAEKNATLPLQIANDLDTQGLNQSFYKWMLDGGVREFIKQSNRMYGEGGSSEINGLMQRNLSELDIESDQMALLEKWIRKGGDATYLPFKRTTRNTIKKQLIDKANLFTPRNVHGSQSVLIPDFTDYGSPNHLRNTVFKTEWDKERSGNTEDIKSRDVWTYGQIEIDASNRGKRVVKDRVRIIEHNDSSKDRILSPKDNPKEISDLLKGPTVLKLNELFKALESVNEGVEGKRYEIALVVHRTPTTRPSDKVIVGLKGFGMEGNSARINHADGWFRLEMDFDLDKVNYWWDTPSDILRFWDSKAGKVPSVKAEQERSSIRGLNPFNGEALVNYNYSEARSSVLRGVVAKSRNTIQFLKFYTGYYNEIPGFSMKDNRGRIVLADERIKDKTDEILARDIQAIIDAQGRGYDELKFNEEWENKLLFGDGEEYPGLFRFQTSTETKDGKVWEDATSEKAITDLHKDIITTVLRPYKRMLNLRTSIFENGEQKKVDYDTLLDYTRQYMYNMSNVNRYVYWTLRKGRGKSGIKRSEDELNAVFKEHGRDINPIGLQSARFDKAKKGEDASDQNYNMIAADRMAGNLGGWDRLTQKKIKPNTQDKVDEIVMEYLMANTSDTAAATKEILDAFTTDFKKLDALNGIDFRLRRYRRSQRKMEAVGNHDMAQHFKNSYDGLRDLRNEINKEVMMSPTIARTVRTRVMQQITETLMKGGEWTDKNKNKYNFSSYSVGARRAAVESIRNTIAASVFDYRNKKLAVDIRGINTDDYAQMLATYNIMSKLTGVGLDPAYVGPENAKQWDMDIYKFKRDYGKRWWEFLNNRSKDDIDQNAIMNESLIELEQLYYKWEDVAPGLGRHLVLGIMTPKISNKTVTYHKGHIMPGFDKVQGQAKFITLGFRFFDRMDSNLSNGLMDQLAKPISNQLAWMRGEANAHYHLDGAEMRDLKALDFQDAEGGSPLIDISGNSGAFHKKISELATKAIGTESIPAELKEHGEFQKVNKEVLSILGLTGDMALDYIAFKLPSGGLDLIGSLSALTEFNRIPTNALSKSGKILPVNGIDSYFRHKMNQVRVFFGSPDDSRNMFTGKRTKVAGDVYGSPDYHASDKASMKTSAERWANENGICP